MSFFLTPRPHVARNLTELQISFLNHVFTYWAFEAGVRADEVKLGKNYYKCIMTNLRGGMFTSASV